MAEILRTTPLHALHQRLGARLVPYAGWEMPVQYAGVKAEHLAVRSGAGVFDVSHMGEYIVRGPDALAALNRLITNDLERLENSQALYTCCCNDAGGILDDLIVYRLTDDEFLVVCNAANHDKIGAHLRAELTGVDVTDESDITALLAIQGPKAVALFSAVLEDSTLPKLRPFRIRDALFRGRELRVARTGYTGEDGFEVFCPNDVAPELFSAVLEEGRALGAVPAGLAARDTLRLEARLSLYGNDISEQTNPLEAGLSWTVKFGKTDFIGKGALERVRRQGPIRTFVGFEMTGRGIARQGYPLLDAKSKPVGECTSGAPSPTLEKSIGLGYLPPAMSALGTEFLVDCRGKHVAAKVVETPFYKRAR